MIFPIKDCKASDMTENNSNNNIDVPLTVAFCNATFADNYLSKHRWAENWNDADGDEREAVLLNATKVIQQFCTFYEEVKHLPELSGVGIGEGKVIHYEPADNSDQNGIPSWLKIACCYQALYFLDLDNDPARPFPLGILGIIQSGQDKFDHEYEPPLFSSMCRRILENNGAKVLDPNSSSAGWGRKKYI